MRLYIRLTSGAYMFAKILTMTLSTVPHAGVLAAPQIGIDVPTNEFGDAEVNPRLVGSVLDLEARG